MQPLVAIRATPRLPVPVAVAKKTETVVAKDPAPSKMNYRLQRLWLRKRVQTAVQVWLPVIGIALVALMIYSNDSLRGFVAQKYENIRGSVAARPELMIDKVSIPVGSADLIRQIDGVIDLALPISALDVDLEGLRQVVQNLSAVKSATVQLMGDGNLEIAIVERMPELVWRNGNRIFLLDDAGVKVAEVPRRSVRFDLPLVIGDGANLAINEAQTLLAMATPLEERIRALVRVGERRWDIVLNNDQVIKLPESNPIDALRLVINMQGTENLMDWNLSVVDMRDPNRPLIRLNDDAINEMRRRRDLALGEPV